MIILDFLIMWSLSCSSHINHLKYAWRERDDWSLVSDTAMQIVRPARHRQTNQPRNCFLLSPSCIIDKPNWAERSRLTKSALKVYCKINPIAITLIWQILRQEQWKFDSWKCSSVLYYELNTLCMCVFFIYQICFVIGASTFCYNTAVLVFSYTESLKMEKWNYSNLNSNENCFIFFLLDHFLITWFLDVVDYYKSTEDSFRQWHTIFMTIRGKLETLENISKY